jgi:hypothetical protein
MGLIVHLDRLRYAAVLSRFPPVTGLLDEKLEPIFDTVVRRSPAQPDFRQTVHEVLTSRRHISQAT